ncbi:MAG: Holliday junction branch migration protein RuvA [Muribaculaceae bacterium]|nr:Holliday junction branch migration protein RuvA [Muribaculaceae bacterium]MBQ5408364.1 Holliday junction branch migration protein RuvA [Muribaculaceae bacterium]MDY6293132.1 Holliday junction branch migration protein RuvA [Bacteroidales bacterium]MDY6413032.1 Holliday junction branch migration protein RuvA [Bacteroidales bacterium]
MYDYITGKIAELNPAFVVLDNGGVGYMINISFTTYNEIAKMSEQSVKLFVYEAIREDAHVLYGFMSRRERELFLMLISVSGVGPNTARMILSSLSANELEQCIASGNVGMLKGVKGIGAKTAQRILVDLKDKIKVAGDTLLDNNSAPSAVYDEALAALAALGFTQQVSQKALKKLLKDDPSITVEAAIKNALKIM